MATRDESHVLVSDPNGDWPTGVLSSLDVMAVLSGRDPGITRILRPAPARPLVSATASAELDRAAALMVEHETAHVVVVDRAGAPAGVVSTLDVLRIVAAS